MTEKEKSQALLMLDAYLKLWSILIFIGLVFIVTGAFQIGLTIIAAYAVAMIVLRFLLKSLIRVGRGDED